jgi:DNA invertase Pin-like site-specific DNA recombinase
VDTSSALGRFFLTVIAGAAELERNQIAERTAAVMRHKTRRGQYTGGHIPYGFTLDEDGIHLQPDAQEQEVIGLAQRLRGRGLSYVKIAAELERRSVPARSGRWHPQKVSNMLARS